jgi:hypothetical protein
MVNVDLLFNGFKVVIWDNEKTLEIVTNNIVTITNAIEFYT